MNKLIKLFRSDLAKLKEIPVLYEDDSMRLSNRIINFNGMLLRNIHKIVIQNCVISFLDGKSNELARYILQPNEHLEISEYYCMYNVRKQQNN